MNNWSEYVGYLASAFVVISFLLKNIRTIRMVNLLGCICFVIYGVYGFGGKQMWPIIIPNAVLAVIQIYHIIKKD